MQDDTTPPRPDAGGPRYRTIEFADGLLVFDRHNTAGWIHSDRAVSLVETR
jgi:hypothetical protein